MIKIIIIMCDVYLAFHQWYSVLELRGSSSLFREFQSSVSPTSSYILSLIASSLLPFSALALLSCAPCLCPWPCPCISDLCPRHNQCPDLSWSYLFFFLFFFIYFFFSFLLFIVICFAFTPNPLFLLSHYLYLVGVWKKK